MKPSEFAAWRTHLGLSKRQAAEALGMHHNQIAHYEAGHRNGRPVAIPRTVELACAALALGIAGYSGPPTIYHR